MLEMEVLTEFYGENNLSPSGLVYLLNCIQTETVLLVMKGLRTLVDTTDVL